MLNLKSALSDLHNSSIAANSGVPTVAPNITKVLPVPDVDVGISGPVEVPTRIVALADGEEPPAVTPPELLGCGEATAELTNGAVNDVPAPAELIAAPLPVVEGKVSVSVTVCVTGGAVAGELVMAPNVPGPRGKRSDWVEQQAVLASTPFSQQ